MSAVAQPVRGDPAERINRIERRRGWIRLDLRELWTYRELLFLLVWRDVKVRYQQTFLGIAWAILQPVLQMVIFTVIFGRLAGIQPEYKVPYPLFVFVGLLPWQYFASTLQQSSTSVVGSSALVTKVYFPRLLMPLASVGVPIVDFLLGACVLGGMFAYYGQTPHWHAVAIPFFLGMALLTAFGAGLWLSALNVRYRDIPYVVPFLTQIWFLASPVVYGVSLVPERYHWLIALNPMTGVIDGFRWAVLGRGLPHYNIFFVSIGVGLALALSGLWYFKRVERYFADVI